ncbi:hypothetical protein BBC27_09505 [Acidithiobacillus ferrivorans]|uniref:Uncharacterized protein n=1 Tax=Acidithiobacillus ferrivorans TaxID=160808 RepID=A0A1B9BZF6_9PROT|nr:hypothetical protein [Acidithiobacillus ferrivorans]OCB03081.1 hypothetical protein BBC27_09505 [Acidithiobacillus ferrivorans]
MAFVKVPQPAEDDEYHEVKPRTDYKNMSAQELSQAAEEACMDASGYDPHDLRWMDAIPEKFHILYSEDFLDLPDAAQEALLREKAQWDADQANAQKPAPRRPLSLQRRMANGLKRLRQMAAQDKPLKMAAQVVIMPQNNAPRRTQKRRGAEGKKQAAAGDSPTDPEPEPERHRNPLHLYDQAALADLLVIDKHTVQNIFSKTPWLLPPAISIPGARGPRWLPAVVQEWLEQRPQHTPKPVPVAPKRSVGRPRIALAKAGVQS